MPSQKQEFTYLGKTPEQLLQIAYGTFLELGWTPKYAGPGAIIGYTPRSWNKYEDEVLIEAKEGGIIVTSSLVHNESFDMMGKNKKHINDFIATFDKINSTEPNPERAEEIEKLRQQTVETATKESKQSGEIDKAMNLSGSNLYVTYAIIAINVIVFILMAIDGAEIFVVTDGLVHAKWGSNITALTFSGDWWRLITSTFIHFGIIHLVMNMYALYSAGIYLEPMLGKTKYITAYLCTGVIAGIVSLWWHKEGVNAAGASGAIFGLYGVFLALLLTNLIPKQTRVALLQSIGIFVVFNLVYGMKSGIDNAAHIGGLISGLLIGFIFYLEMSGKLNVKKPFLIFLITILTVAGTWYFLTNYKSDSTKVDQLLNEFYALEQKAMESLKTTSNTTVTEYKETLTTVTMPTWKKALEKINELETLSMSESRKEYQQKAKKYSQLRIDQTELLIKAQDAPEGTFNKELEDVANKIEVIFEKKE